MFDDPNEKPDSLMHSNQHQRKPTAPWMTAETKPAGSVCHKQIDEWLSDRGITEHVAELYSTFHPLMMVSCATPAHNRSMNRAVLLFSLMLMFGIWEITIQLLA